MFTPNGFENIFISTSYFPVKWLLPRLEHEKNKQWRNNDHWYWGLSGICLKVKRFCRAFTLSPFFSSPCHMYCTTRHHKSTMILPLVAKSRTTQFFLCFYHNKFSLSLVITATKTFWVNSLPLYLGNSPEKSFINKKNYDWINICRKVHKIQRSNGPNIFLSL